MHTAIDILLIVNVVLLWIVIRTQNKTLKLKDEMIKLKESTIEFQEYTIELKNNLIDTMRRGISDY